MKNRFSIIVILCLMTTQHIPARQIIDMAGRTVEIPDVITGVVPYDNKTNVILYPIAHEKMMVKARAKVSPDLKYITKEYLRLPEVDTRNAEEVIKLQPDFIVVAAFVNNRTSLDNYVRFSEKINVPLVFVDLELMHLDKSFRFLGELFNCQDRATEYVNFLSNVFTDIEKVTRQPVKARIYLANNNNGLRTAPKGSWHAQLLDVMRVQNVAETGLNQQGFGIASIEQILNWDPEYIFCLGKSGASPYRTILKSALWKNIDAVKNKKVYFIPSEPYPWFDMPPSINRIAGLIWFMEVFYRQSPEVTREKIKTFYYIFYSYELTDKEYAHLFVWQ